MPPENRRRRNRSGACENTQGWTQADLDARDEQRRREKPIAELGLSVRIVNTLEANGVFLAGQLLTLSYETLMAMRNFGDATLVEVCKALIKNGLKPPAWNTSTVEAPARADRQSKHLPDFWN